jgi:hypothetical protein
MRTIEVKAYPRPSQMVKGYNYKGPITFDPKYGWLASGQFSAECIAECSHSGQCALDVEFWRKRLKFAEALEPIRPLAERYLKEFGAWDDLSTADIDTLADRILWTACNDIAEQGEWLGLVH